MRGVLLDPRTGRPEERHRAKTYTPITDLNVMEDIGILAGIERASWRDRIAEIDGPSALIGGIAGLEANPPADAIPAVTLTLATEVAAWVAGTYTPIPAGRSPVQYELYVAGTLTNGAGVSQTLTLTPRYGTSTAGLTLGASQPIALTASVGPVQFQLRGEVTVRGTGIGSTRVYGTFSWIGKMATTGTGAVDSHHIFGYTAVTTGDSTGAQGLFLGATQAVAAGSMTIQQIKWGSWN